MKKRRSVEVLAEKLKPQHTFKRFVEIGFYITIKASSLEEAQRKYEELDLYPPDSTTFSILEGEWEQVD